MGDKFSLEGINQPLETPDIDALLNLIDKNGKKWRSLATILKEDARGYKFLILHRKKRNDL